MSAEWSIGLDELADHLSTTDRGLTSTEAAARVDASRSVRRIRRNTMFDLLVRQFRNPTILIMVAVAIVAAALGEVTESMIVIAIVAASGILGFIQETGAVRAVDALLSSVEVHSDVLRDGMETEVLVDDVVPGDVVVLRAGDVIPGDGRVVESNLLHVDESALTGESAPRHKEPGVAAVDRSLAERSNFLHFGTYVASGQGRMMVTRIGLDTEFGRLARHVVETHVPTAFERGVASFGRMLVRAMAILVIAIFALNIFLDRPVIESVLYSLALAIGLTPQMLPAIVTFSLARGATVLARRRVIVKRLDAIEDIGGLDILCVDKTGTLTEGGLRFDRAVDWSGRPSPSVLALARTNAQLQRGFDNPLDRALEAAPGDDPPRRVDEIPFDFARKRLSVVVEDDSQHLLICKGAVESVLSACGRSGGETEPTHELMRSTYTSLTDAGLRVLGVATKRINAVGRPSADDEHDLVFQGFVTFIDPVKAGVIDSVRRLDALGVRTKIITGDNLGSAIHTARAIGLDGSKNLEGPRIANLSDRELADLVDEVEVFAETDPIQKERIVRALSTAGHSVGFLGDGINDSPALHAADVGISVDSAVDIAKQAADLVLLTKDLSVVANGIEEGRRIFVNTMKYVHVTTSANFGNMLSLAAATAFLPFLPLLPLQVLLLNFLSDVPGMSIATDTVDAEQMARPVRWNIEHIRRFMIVFGLMSTVFDLVTFMVLRIVFSANEVDLRSGWFVESMLNEIAVLLMLRTSRRFWRSRPSPALLGSSIAVALVTIVIPYAPFAERLGFRGPSPIVLSALLLITLVSIAVTENLKKHWPSLVGSDH
ncbi:MAG: magnesium-translocating P-type ATPase [Acidimicrobiales bacterium mtb01]|nr:magnesium-translocating P-type ATPase [Actinomycetota bacterium]TEX46686.1 MAG: magnesium-translocating P-type ATPase [Acidimicrobiales bacterium mtb01]